MLKHLSIINYAIIESLEINLSEGFSVITGETGAGKSIILGALSLVLGNRSDTSVLNSKDKKCIVEGEFLLEKDRYLPFFKTHDLDFETLSIIRREISTSGKSRAFINDTPVSLSILKELTTNLIDIHSQHETLQLKQNDFQINVLDSYSKINSEVLEYKKEYNLYKQYEHNLKNVLDSSSKAKEDFNYLSFQAQEIEALDLKLNEKEDIEQSLKVLNNSEEIKAVLELSSSILSNSDVNVISSLKELENDFNKISNLSEEYSLLYERLHSSMLELEDLSIEINRLNDDFEFDAENLSYLTERLGKIYNIEQKHRLNSTQQILDLLAELKSKITDVSTYDERINEQKLLVDKQKKKLEKLAKNISEKRKDSLRSIEKEVVLNLKDLGMPDASFKVEITKLLELNVNGIDKIEFLFSANKGFKPKEIGKVASGGELSRLMLVVKKFLSQGNEISTIIFDEIDTGVSGDIADKIADLMKQISNDTQILSITHLPQVAAKGDCHLKILKKTIKDKTSTSINILNNTERVEELAKMLSGKNLTDAAINNAKVLLNN